MWRKLVTVLLVLGIVLSVPLQAVISVPFVFTPFTTISSSQVNSNFSTIAEAALNRHGDTIDGNIAVANGITIDGADISTYLAGGKLTASNTSATSVTAGGGITAGTGAVGIVGTDGRIPAISSTYFASLTPIPLQAYQETKTAPSISAGALAIDLSQGTYFVISGTGSATVSFSNPAPTGKVTSFTLAFVGTGSAYTLTWPAAVKWPSGLAPTPTSTNGKTDVFSFLTYDGGTTYYGFISGQNY